MEDATHADQSPQHFAPQIRWSLGRYFAWQFGAMSAAMASLAAVYRMFRVGFGDIDNWFLFVAGLAGLSLVFYTLGKLRRAELWPPIFLPTKGRAAWWKRYLTISLSYAIPFAALHLLQAEDVIPSVIQGILFGFIVGLFTPATTSKAKHPIIIVTDNTAAPSPEIHA